MPEVGDIVIPKVSNSATIGLAVIAILVVVVLVYLVLSDYQTKAPAVGA